MSNADSTTHCGHWALVVRGWRRRLADRIAVPLLASSRALDPRWPLHVLACTPGDHSQSSFRCAAMSMVPSMTALGTADPVHSVCRVAAGNWKLQSSLQRRTFAVGYAPGQWRQPPMALAAWVAFRSGDISPPWGALDAPNGTLQQAVLLSAGINLYMSSGVPTLLAPMITACIASPGDC